MTEKIFEDDEVTVYFCSTECKNAVISYSPMNHNFAAKGIPALPALQHAGFDVFGVIAKRNNWYPKNSMAGAIAAMRARLQRYHRRIGYGSSMGAHGALKYSNLMQCDYVFALAPQYSINPEQVATWDTRFTRHFRPEINREMEISEGDLSGTVVFVVDPAQQADMRHAGLIADAAGPSVNVEYIRAWHCGHTVINPIASSQSVESLFHALIVDDIPKMREIYRKARKSSIFFRASLMDTLAKHQMKKGNLDAALRAADESVQAYNKFAAFYMTKSRVHSMRKEFDFALDDARRALEIEPGGSFLKQFVDEAQERRDSSAGLC